jgi:glycosyltransferase involved in cell wall biosynthesis
MSKGKKKHNLLFIDSGFGYGGSAVFLYNFLCKLDKETFNPTVLFYFAPQGKDVENIKNLGIEVLNLGMRPEKKEDYSFAAAICQDQKNITKLKIFKSYLSALQELIQQDLPAAFNLAKFIKKKNIQLVVLNNDLHYHVPGVLAAKLAKARCVCRKAGIGGGRKIKKILGRFVDAFAATSQATAQDQTQLKVPTKRLLIFYEGVDIEKYTPTKTGTEIKKEFNLSKDRPIIGCVARIGVGKGQGELIQAASLVVKEFPQAIFLIVGDDIEFGGILTKRLKREATQLGVTENLIFTGWRTDIPNILGGLDVFVHCPTSWPEGLGIATLEAMAMGKPTIVSDNFGLTETTQDKVTGFVVPKGDALALSRAILTLLKDKQLASDMGKRARDRAERLFDIRKSVHQTEKLFLELLH